MPNANTTPPSPRPIKIVARIDSMREGYRMIADERSIALIDAIGIRLSAITPSAPKLTGGTMSGECNEVFYGQTSHVVAIE